jgi:hypothetical protein
MRYRLNSMRSSLARKAVFLAVLPYVLLGQNRFGDGEFKGFTKSPTEHIINRYEGIVAARTFEGSVFDPTGAPMPGALVEVRGPGTSERIKGTVADKRGQFKIGRLNNGTYAFKITYNGFQSVVGRLQIDSAAERKAPIKITLQLGV